MYNDLFHIGRFTIHGYGTMIAIGVLVAVGVAILRCKKQKIDPEPILDLVLIGLIGGFAGGKLLFIIVEWKNFIHNPKGYLGGSGFVVYGGIILAVVIGVIYFKLKKMDFLTYWDMIMPEISLAQGFGRIGCFLAGCCYGAETHSHFGVVFPEGSFAPAGVKLWPTQLMMSVGNFIIAGILLLASKKLKKRGQIGSLYLILYAIGRFGIEFLRNDHRGTVGVFSTSQFISLFIVVIGIGLFVWRTLAEDKKPVVETAKGTKKSSGEKKSVEDKKSAESEESKKNAESENSEKSAKKEETATDDEIKENESDAVTAEDAETENAETEDTEAENTDAEETEFADTILEGAASLRAEIEESLAKEGTATKAEDGAATEAEDGEAAE